MSPVSSDDALLATAVMTVTRITAGERLLGTASIAINDQGYTGDCSATNPSPCAKFAHATVYFDVGDQPERLFRSGFEMH